MMTYPGTVMLQVLLSIECCISPLNVLYLTLDKSQLIHCHVHHDVNPQIVANTATVHEDLCA